MFVKFREPTPPLHEGVQSPIEGDKRPPLPVIDVSDRAPSAGDTVVFDGNNSTSPTGTEIVDYRWEDNDGITIRGSKYEHTFDNSMSGSQSFSLTVEDEEGRTETANIVFYFENDSAYAVPEITSVNVPDVGPGVEPNYTLEYTNPDGLSVDEDWIPESEHGGSFPSDNIGDGRFREAGFYRVRIQIIAITGPVTSTYTEQFVDVFVTDPNIVTAKLIEGNIERKRKQTDIGRLYVRRDQITGTTPEVTEATTEAFLVESEDTSVWNAEFGGVIYDLNRSGASTEVVTESFERYSKQAPPLRAAEIPTNASPADEVTQTINEIDLLALGTVDSTSAEFDYTFSNDTPAKKIRQYADILGLDAVYNPDKTVDFTSMGENRTSTVLSPSNQNVEDDFSAEKKGSADEYTTHIRVLGAGEGQHQLVAERTVDWYQSGDPESWDVVPKKDLNTQGSVDAYADKLKNDYNTQDHIEVTTTANIDEVGLGDVFGVENQQEALPETEMRVVELTEVYDGDGVTYGATLSTRTETRETSGEKRRQDTENFNTSIQGAAVPINAGGGRQPVDNTHNYTMRLYYPAEVYHEHRLNIRAMGLPYRAYSSGAAIVGGDHLHNVTFPFSNLTHRHDVNLADLAHIHGIDGSQINHDHGLDGATIAQLLAVTGVVRDTQFSHFNEDVVLPATTTPVSNQTDLADGGESDVFIHINGTVASGSLSSGSTRAIVTATITDVGSSTQLGTAVIKTGDGGNFSTALMADMQGRTGGTIEIELTSDDDQGTGAGAVDVENVTVNMTTVVDHDHDVNGSGSNTTDQETFSDFDTDGAQWSGSDPETELTNFSDHSGTTEDAAGDPDAPPDPGIVEVFDERQFYPEFGRVLVNGSPINDTAYWASAEQDQLEVVTWTASTSGDVTDGEEGEGGRSLTFRGTGSGSWESEGYSAVAPLQTKEGLVGYEFHSSNVAGSVTVRVVDERAGTEHELFSDTVNSGVGDITWNLSQEEIQDVGSRLNLTRTTSPDPGDKVSVDSFFPGTLADRYNVVDVNASPFSSIEHAEFSVFGANMLRFQGGTDFAEQPQNIWVRVEGEVTTADNALDEQLDVRIGEIFGVHEARVGASGVDEFEDVVDIRGDLEPGQTNVIEISSTTLGHMQVYVEGDVYRQITGNG